MIFKVAPRKFPMLKLYIRRKQLIVRLHPSFKITYKNYLIFYFENKSLYQERIFKMKIKDDETIEKDKAKPTIKRFN